MAKSTSPSAATKSANGLPAREYRLEAGTGGLKAFAGYITEEYDPNLRGQRGMRMYREMQDVDSTIGAVLFVINQTIRKLAWKFQPAGQSVMSLLAQEFFESLMVDLDHTWDDMVSEILTMLPYGYAPMELVLKIRKGDNNADPRFSSKFDDGMVGVRKIALRAQETVLRWVMDSDNNDILGMVQMPWTGGIRMIPISKMLLFRTTKVKNNPEGRSILRSAYRSYYLRKRIEELEGIGIERDLAGLPVMYVPGELIAAATAATPDPAAVKAYQTYVNLIKNVRRNAQEGVLLPGDRDEHGQRMFELELLNSGGRRNFDTNVTINRYTQNIATVVLADFLLLGHSAAGGGSQALGTSKIEVFFTALAGFTKLMVDVFNSDFIPTMSKLNGIPLANQPTLEVEKPEQVDLGRLGAYVNALAASGMTLFPNTDLETYLLEIAGMPPPTDETLQQQAGIAAQGGEFGQPGAGGLVQPGQLGHNDGPPMGGAGAPPAGGGAPPSQQPHLMNGKGPGANEPPGY